MQPIVIAPSILSADWARLGEEIATVLEAGADWIHFDVMDNHYVPNLTMGAQLCKALRNYGIKAPIDVHLMVKPVDRLISMFIEAGANIISFHPEASDHVDRSLALIREGKVKAGLAFNPSTPLTILPYVQEKVDLVLLMSVNPGFGGQKFIQNTLSKIKEARTWIEKHSPTVRLEVDGGITLDNVKAIHDAGADTFVAGSAIFNAENYPKTIEAFRKALSGPKSS